MVVPKAIGSDVPNLTKDVPKFGKDVPRVPKCVPRWGLAPNQFLMGSKMKSWTIHVQLGDPKAIGSNVTYLIMDVPNFVNDVPKVSKCVLRWGSAPNHFLMGSKMQSWTIHVQMGDLKIVESDVSNLMKNVPNFVKDVPRVPKCVPRWGSTPNHFIMVSK